MIDYLEDLLSQVVEEKMEEEAVAVTLADGDVGVSGRDGDAVAVAEGATATEPVLWREGEPTSGLRYHREADVGTSADGGGSMAWSHGEGDAVVPALGEGLDVTAPFSVQQVGDDYIAQEKQGAVEALYSQMGGSRSGVVETLQRERMTHQVAVAEGGASVTNTRVVEQLVLVETGMQANSFDRYAQRDARRYDGGFTLY